MCIGGQYTTIRGQARPNPTPAQSGDQCRNWGPNFPKELKFTTLDPGIEAIRALLTFNTEDEKEEWEAKSVDSDETQANALLL